MKVRYLTCQEGYYYSSVAVIAVNMHVQCYDIISLCLFLECDNENNNIIMA